MHCFFLVTFTDSHMVVALDAFPPHLDPTTIDDDGWRRDNS